MKTQILNLYHFLSPNYQTLHLEYKVTPKPRFSPHPVLYDLINKNRGEYFNFLQKFLKYSDNIHQIKDAKLETEEDNPTWNNGYLPGLDIITLYGMISELKPSRYIEIGSGNSTKVARMAVKEQHLDTEIVSIDPYPRANIDHLADKVIREPLENVEDLSVITNNLEENDILFIDSSHRVFSNSDATVCFLELLPMLKSGAVIHFHDIYLPYDYPQFMCDRFYNEQYMLAAFLLGGHQGSKYKLIMPNYFVSQDKELFSVVAPVWNHENLQNVEKHGGSFWLKIL